MHSSAAPLRVAVVGASGYGGSELLRLLLRHPRAEVRYVTAREHAGKAVSEVHPNLMGVQNLAFLPALGDREYEEVDVVFLALPHGGAMRMAASIPAAIRIIDLSGDFRLSSKRRFESFYGFEHTAMPLQKHFVYGLPEILSQRIAKAKRIANPGCFATGTILALYPLCHAGWTEGTVIVDAKTGSSGSGIKPAEGTHHPRRANSFYAYKVFDHQHLPEIAQMLPGLGSMKELVFQPHSAPMVRGILASAYVTLRKPVTAARLRELYREYYGGCPFVRLREEPPNVVWVKNSNYADIACYAQGRHATVFCAIDNLVKGGAGQAIQNMNLMFGLEETAGLDSLPSNP